VGGAQTRSSLDVIDDLPQKKSHATGRALRRCVRESVLIALSMGILSCIVIAGLWPFSAPKNDVNWIPVRDGLRFGPHGTITSAPKSALNFERKPIFCTIEIWLEAASSDSSSTLLSFYSPDSREQFSLHQSISDLLLQTGRKRLYVDDLFKERKQRFVTLTSGPSGIQVFVDGLLEEISPRMAMACDGLAGPMVIGTSIAQGDAWQGELLGLAFYESALKPDRVMAHYRSWTRSRNPVIDGNDRAIAVYLFQEHTGTVVHSLLPSGKDLRIPQRFEILDQAVLASPLRGFHTGWGYWSDVLTNVLGFLPLGFVFCAWANQLVGKARATTLAAIFGCAISFTIEILQSHLPTRHSDLTDVFTNTLGTCVGAWLYAWTPLGVLFGTVLARFDQTRPEPRY
jgi:VanZ like protein